MGGGGVSCECEGELGEGRGKDEGIDCIEYGFSGEGGGGQVPTKAAKVINCLLSVLRRMQVFAKCVQSFVVFYD